MGLVWGPAVFDFVAALHAGAEPRVAAGGGAVVGRARGPLSGRELVCACGLGVETVVERTTTYLSLCLARQLCASL